MNLPLTRFLDEIRPSESVFKRRELWLAVLWLLSVALICIWEVEQGWYRQAMLEWIPYCLMNYYGVARFVILIMRMAVAG